MEINKNHIKGGIVGLIIGCLSCAGLNSLVQSKRAAAFFTSEKRSEQKISMYDRLEYDDNGSIYVTPNGKKYHNPWCHVIKKKNKLKRTTVEAAEELGYEPCSKCN